MDLLRFILAVSLALAPAPQKGADAPRATVSFGTVRGWPGDNVFVPVFLSAAAAKIRILSFQLDMPGPELTFVQVEPSITTRQSGAKLEATREGSTVRVTIAAADEKTALGEELVASLKLTISMSITTAAPLVVGVRKIEVVDVGGGILPLKDTEMKVDVSSPATEPIGMCFFYMH